MASSSQSASSSSSAEEAEQKKNMFEIFSLIYSASRGDVDGVAKAAESVNVNEGDYDGRTALHLSASEGHLSVVKWLLSKGAAVNAEDRWGGTPLQDAMAGKHDEVATALRNAGAKILNTAVLADKLTAACSKGDLPLVKRLLENGALVNVPDYDGRTALHLAASEGHIFTVEFLVDRGADVNATDRWGGTPLMDAIKNKHDTVAQFLSSRGAELVNNDAVGAQLCNAAATGALGVLKRVLGSGGSLDGAMDYDHRTPLHLAAAGGYLSVVEYLVDQGANINAQDRWKGTPLSDAERHRHASVAEYLKSKGGVIVDSSAAELGVSNRFLLSSSKGAAEPTDGVSELNALKPGDVVKKIVAHLAHPDFIALCLSVLVEQLSKGDDDHAAKGAVMYVDGGEVILGAMQSYPEKDAIHIAGAGVLEQLGLVDRYAIEITKHGAVRILLDLVQSSQTLEVRRNALAALSAITFMLEENPVHIATAFTHNNGVNIVLAGARRGNNDHVTVKRSIQTLWHACIIDASNLERMQVDGGLEAITHHWKEFQRREDIAHSAAGCVAILLHSPANQYTFRERLGGVELALNTLKIHNTDDDLLVLALQILNILAISSHRDAKSASPAEERGRSIIQIFVEQKASNLIVSVMRSHKRHRRINELSASILINVAKAAKAKGLRSAVLEKSAGKAVHAAAKRHANSDDLVLIDREISMMKGCTIM